MKLLLNYTSATVLLLLLLGSAVDARRSYQAKIPNGDKVSNPCDSSTLWPGVGHWNKDGGGTRNPFGVAFYANGLVWNATVCQMDSDGDGRTNGDELGDPQCVWTEGGTPSRTDGITHPSVCEPVSSANCVQRNGNNIPCGSIALRSAFGLLCATLLAGILLR